MHVLNDKSVLDPATLAEHQQEQEDRLARAHWAKQVRAMKDQTHHDRKPEGPDPRWEGLPEIGV